MTPPRPAQNHCASLPEGHVIPISCAYTLIPAKNPTRTPARQGPIIALGFFGLPLFSWLILCLLDVWAKPSSYLDSKGWWARWSKVNLTQDSGQRPSALRANPPAPSSTNRDCPLSFDGVCGTPALRTSWRLPPQPSPWQAPRAVY